MTLRRWVIAYNVSMALVVLWVLDGSLETSRILGPILKTIIAEPINAFDLAVAWLLGMFKMFGFVVGVAAAIYIRRKKLRGQPVKVRFLWAEMLDLVTEEPAHAE